MYSLLTIFLAAKANFLSSLCVRQLLSSFPFLKAIKAAHAQGGRRVRAAVCPGLLRPSEEQSGNLSGEVSPEQVRELRNPGT